LQVAAAYEAASLELMQKTPITAYSVTY
jgi:hypothetical protein